MPPRLGHRKSRNGCAQCKARHVKCDEVRPQCGTCHRLKLDCAFNKDDHLPSARPPRAPTPNANDNDRPSPTTDGRQPLTPTANIHAPAFNLFDMSIFKHYSQSTSLTLSRDGACTHIYTDLIPDLACRHDYLMHALLAVAALHKYSVQAHDKTLLTSAADHLHRALTAGRPAIAALSRHSADSLLAYSALVSMYYFALPIYEPRGLLFSPLEAFIDMIAFMRRNAAVAIGTEQWVREGPLRPLLGLDRPRDPEFDPGSDVCGALDWLESHLNTLSYDSEEAKLALLTNARDLKNCAAAATLTMPPLEFSRVFRWPAMTPDEVHALLRARHPGALSVLACWCPCLKRSHGSWLVGAWRDLLLPEIGRLIQHYSWADQLDDAVHSIDAFIDERERLLLDAT